MNRSSQSDIPELEPPLESAVWAVVGERLPADALERIKQRAKLLASPQNDSTDAALTSRTIDLTPTTPLKHTQSTSSRRRLRIGAALALTASLVVVALTSLTNPSSSMAQVVNNTIAQRWVHGVANWYPASTDRKTDIQHRKPVDANSTNKMETWFSSELGISAARLTDRILFEDRLENVSVSYEIGSSKAIQTLPVPFEMKPLGQGQSLLDRLRLLQEHGSSEFGFVVSDLKQFNMQVNGDAMLHYTCRLRQPGNPGNEHELKLTLNSRTQLIDTLEETYKDGSRRVTQFDYPSSGPTNLYAAGVPADVEVVDRRASTDVRQLESTWTKARTEFDDYDAIYVQVPDGLEHSVFTGLNADIKRVRRAGNRYRIDMLLRLMPGVEPPADESDMDQWWKANRDQFWSVPLLICDGSTVTYYAMVDGSLPKTGKPNLNVKVSNQHPVHGFGKDRPVAWPHLMPEYACRPFLWTIDVKQQFEYSPTPDDGPGDSVRLIVNRPDETMTPERHRYWLDPARQFCVTRMVQPVFEPKSSEVAYVDTEEFFDFKQSPTGFWYPTRVERVTSEAPYKQIRTFHVNFVKTLASALFEPVEISPNK